MTELTGILGLAQSGVSRHLGLLKEAGFVVEEKDGGYTYYRVRRIRRRRIAADLGRSRRPVPSGATDPAVRADEARLQEVLRLRKENFDTHAGADTAMRVSSCRDGAGRRGRVRWDSCCRPWRSRISAAAKGI